MDETSPTRPMTDTEQQLNRLHEEIQYHRDKATSLRKRAEAQDRIADGKVRIAAELGTGTLPLLSGSESNPPYVEGTSEDPRASFTKDGTCRMD